MEFMYFLTLIDRLKTGPWAEEDEAVIGRHFNHLVSLQEKGKLAFAGRTQVEDDKTVGLVLLFADSLEEAIEMMNQDPAIKENIMTGEIAPFATAIKGQWKS
jgi:uncharacterized protein YciI